MRWKSRQWPAVGTAALCLCLGWPGTGSAQDRPKGPERPGPRGHVIQIDLDRLPPDLARQLLPYVVGGPPRREQPLPRSEPAQVRRETPSPRERPGAPDHPPDAARQFFQFFARGPKGPPPGPKGPGPAHGPPGPGKGDAISIIIQIPVPVANRLLDVLEDRLAKKPHEKKEHGPKESEKPPKKPKPKKGDEP